MKGCVRFALRTAVAISVCLAVFFLRKRAVGSLFAFSDALSVCGFLFLSVSLFPKIAKGESFDGFAYAAGCALAGLFPRLSVSYRDFKAERRQKAFEKAVAEKGSENGRFYGYLGGVLFSVGLLLAFIFA